MPVAPALMILFQVERHDSELHRPCSVAPARPGYAAYDPTVSKWCLRYGRRVAARFVSCSRAAHLSLAYPRSGVPWHQARRDPTGLSPDPARHVDEVINGFGRT